MTERKPLPRYWTTEEIQTWACDDGVQVHMFPAGLVTDSPIVCHTCAVIWDSQQARRAGMDVSEGRGWGAAYGDAEHVHRFRTIELDATVELTYCTPHRVPMLGHMRGTLDEYVDPIVPPCPVCLVATDAEEPAEAAPQPSTVEDWAQVKEKAQAVRRAAQKAVQERRSPVGKELQAWVHELLERMLKEGWVKAKQFNTVAQYNPDGIFRVHVDSFITDFLKKYREEIAAELMSQADMCEAMAELVELNEDDGSADRRRASAYRDAARRVEKWPS